MKTYNLYTVQMKAVVTQEHFICVQGNSKEEAEKRAKALWKNDLEGRGDLLESISIIESKKI